MKKSQMLFAVQLIILVVFSVQCSKKSAPDKTSSKFDTLTFFHSMKGWELYTWPEGDDWKYSILNGTNRLKTYQEVTTNQITVMGIDSLKMLIDKFPVKEEIFWISDYWLKNIWGSNYGNLSLPDTNTVNEVKKYCSSKGLALTIL
jgi:hypothetical protein